MCILIICLFCLTGYDSCALDGRVEGGTDVSCNAISKEKNRPLSNGKRVEVSSSFYQRSRDWLSLSRSFIA